MDFVKLSEQRFTAKKFDVNKKIPRDDVEKLKTILQLSPSSVNSQPWVFLWGHKRQFQETRSSGNCRLQLEPHRHLLRLCRDRR